MGEKTLGEFIVSHQCTCSEMSGWKSLS